MGTVTEREACSTTATEDAGERLDRQWNELLQELRLAQTGTQILFAFLLTIAFQAVPGRRRVHPRRVRRAP